VAVALDKDDALVDFKLKMLDRCMPAQSAVVFGDIWRVDGGYTVACAERGCEEVLLVDSLETPGWQEARLANPQIDFRKGDFSDPLFMVSIRRTYELCVLFDIMLHQPAMLGTLATMLAKTSKRLCIVQPMLEEQDNPGSLVYLPGNPNVDELYPLEKPSSDFQVFDPEQVNHSHWIWAMTRSFFTAAMKGEGYELVHEDNLGPLPNPRWSWWGAVFERQGERPAGHWHAHGGVPGLYTGDW
jgi:hypothetical protein